MEHNTARRIRRVVTGQDNHGRSQILFDEDSPHVLHFAGIPSFGITDIWKTRAGDHSFHRQEDACDGNELVPPHGGTLIRVVEFPPDKEYVDTWDRRTAFSGMGDSGHAALSADSDDQHGMMHRTDTVDYVFILEGEIYLLLDDGEVCLRAGDVLVQQGTKHAWSNRSDKPCVYAAVMIAANEKSLG
jgi:mannose-6-phosphate isomerase-like protein (cupin superfamily)